MGQVGQGRGEDEGPARHERMIDDRDGMTVDDRDALGDQGLGRWCVSDDAAAVQNHDPLGVAGCEVQLVKHHDDRATGTRQLAGDGEDELLMTEVERGGRLVEQDHGGLLGEDAGEVHEPDEVAHDEPDESEDAGHGDGYGRAARQRAQHDHREPGPLDVHAEVAGLPFAEHEEVETTGQPRQHQERDSDERHDGSDRFPRGSAHGPELPERHITQLSVVGDRRSPIPAPASALMATPQSTSVGPGAGAADEESARASQVQEHGARLVPLRRGLPFLLHGLHALLGRRGQLVAGVRDAEGVGDEADLLRRVVHVVTGRHDHDGDARGPQLRDHGGRHPDCR